MTELVVSTASNYEDGYLSCTSTTYSSARKGLGTISQSWLGSGPLVGQRLDGSNYICYESWVYFDTSSIPDTATIDSVELKIYLYNDQSVADFVVRAFSCNEAWDGWISPVDGTDSFILGSSPYLACHSLNTDGIGSNGWKTFTALPYALDNIATAGVNGGETCYLLASSRHVAGSVPTGAEYIGFYSMEQSSGIYAPTLTVNYTAAPAITVAHTSVFGIG